jgi:pimeloyl-ACP methyl ester carboxylesterase
VRQLPLITGALRVPSLWIAGSRDRVMEPRYVRHLAGYSSLHQLELLDGAGHLPMRQQPAQLARLIERWLADTPDLRPWRGAQSVASPFSCNSASRA